MQSRSLLLFLSTLAILSAVCVGATATANIAVNSTLPGDSWFVVRQFKESLVDSFARDASVRGQMRISIARRRLDDLSACVGTSYELAALSNLDDAVNASLVTISELPAEEQGMLLGQLTEVLYGARELLTRTGLAQDQRLLTEFDAQVTAIRTVAEEVDVKPERLRQIAVSFSFTATARAPRSSATVPDRPIPPPPSSRHSFPIDGAHSRIGCDRCHVRQDRAQTPRDCIACHTDPHRTAASRECSSCHTTNAWKPAQSK